MPRAVAVAVAAALALLSAAVAAQPGTVTLLAGGGDVVLDKSPVFSDELTEPRYVVEIAADDADDASPPAPTKTLTLTDSAGRAFACAVPTDDGDGDGTSGDDDEAPPPPPPSTLLAPLVGTCQTRHEDWWTYEFCYGRHVRQFHADADGAVVDAYLLGAGNGTAAAVDDVVRHDAAAPPAQAAYVAAVYGGGVPCELTGVPRAAEVRFVCPEGGGGAVGGGTMAAVATTPGAGAATTAPAASLLSAREPATCSYAVTVGVPALCGHPAFAPVDPPTRTIVCRARGGGGGREEA